MDTVSLIVACAWGVFAARHALRVGIRTPGRRRSGGWAELLIAGPVHDLLWRTRLERSPALQSLLAAVHADRQRLYGLQTTLDHSRAYLSHAAGLGAASVGLLAAASYAAGEDALLYMGALIGALAPAARVQSLRRQVEERRRAILRELPGLLTKLMLFVAAGESLQSALQRCCDAADAGHPLYRELIRALHAARNGESFHQAMDGFARRAGVQETTVLTAALLMQYRKGGMDFALSMRELSFTLWEKRKEIARTRGEEAASKLSLPLALVFLVLMVLVGSPAVLSMS